MNILEDWIVPLLWTGAVVLFFVTIDKLTGITDTIADTIGF